MMNTVYTSHDEFFAANMIASLSNKGTNITAQDSYNQYTEFLLLNMLHVSRSSHGGALYFNHTGYLV